MKKSKIAFIPVDNGNMTLIKLNDNNETTILVDMNIRQSADDESKEEYYDAAEYLREQICTDSQGRPIVDVLLISHLDNDHVAGLEKHFHLKDPIDWKSPDGDDPKKIIIGELWGSTRYQKNHTDNHKLSEDAKAFKKEMKRRVKLNEKGKTSAAGNRVRILGEDHIDSACDGIKHLVSRCKDTITFFNYNKLKDKCEAYVLGPVSRRDGEDDDAFDAKNRGSVIIRLDVYEEGSEPVRILLTADGEVDIWNYTWDDYQSTDLKYDIMSAPHHCSWHSISKDKDAKKTVDKNAINALSQAEEGAFIISQSRLFGDETPPHSETRKEYENIVGKDNFLCTAEEPKKNEVSPIEFIIQGSDGILRSEDTISSSAVAVGMAEVTKEPLGHG